MGGGTNSSNCAMRRKGGSAWRMKRGRVATGWLLWKGLVRHLERATCALKGELLGYQKEEVSGGAAIFFSEAEGTQQYGLFQQSERQFQRLMGESSVKIERAGNGGERTFL